MCILLLFVEFNILSRTTSTRAPVFGGFMDWGHVKHTESAVLGFVVLLVRTFHRGPEHRLQGWFYAANWQILANFDKNFVIPEISVNQVKKMLVFMLGGGGYEVLTAQDGPFKIKNCNSFRGLCPLDPCINPYPTIHLWGLWQVPKSPLLPLCSHSLRFVANFSSGQNIPKRLPTSHTRSISCISAE